MKRNQTNKNKREQPVELGKKLSFHVFFFFLTWKKYFKRNRVIGSVQYKSDEGCEPAVGFSNAEDADSLISKMLP